VHTLAQICPLPIVSVTLEGAVTAWNPAAEAMFGWRASEVLGRPLPIMPDDGAEDLLRLVSARSAEGGFGEHEGVRVHKDGTRIDVSITTAPLDDERGRITGIFAIYQDVGRRRTSEIRRANELSLLRAILDGIPAPVFFKDVRGAYLGCNTAFCRYVGEQHEDIVGKTVYDKWPRDLAETYDAADRELLASRATQTYEAAITYADGSRHDVVFHKGVFFGPDGEIAGQVGTVLDITERKRAERALRESEERHRAVIASLHDGILLKARDGRTLAHNAAAERILGVDASALMAHVGFEPPFEVVDEEGEPFTRERWPLAATLESGTSTSNIVVGFVRRDGARAWALLNSHPLFTPDDEAPHAVVVSFADITERVRAEEQLAHQAHYDALTGLPNRTLFFARAKEAVLKAEPFALLYLDLDGFKRVNDTLGHAAGDALLEVVAERLSACTRARDTVARLGGDEFTVVLAGVSERAQVSAVAKEILSSIAQPITVIGQEVFVGVSIGCAMFPEDGASLDHLQKSADHAMYHAKGAGKSRLCFHEDEDEAAPASGGRLSLEAELRRAIERDELELYYQPKVTATRDLTGFEVLVRWNHPSRGLLLPGAFLPAADRGGLLWPLTEWVMRRACQQVAEWLRAGLTPPRVAVNVSPKQIGDETLVELVARALDESGLPASLLELEVTEDAVIRNMQASAKVLARLRALGVRIAVDDFGTGHNTLSYLRQLPIDTLKIDRSFVMHMMETPSTRPIVEAIVSMGRAFGLSVVAEGVETEDHLEALADLGCDELQGYLVAKPMPAAAFAERFLRIRPTDAHASDELTAPGNAYDSMQAAAE
jgi:diguanylate cyclase (GGDEF)-like protein/PAS domain S-box-containing protein